MKRERKASSLSANYIVRRALRYAWPQRFFWLSLFVLSLGVIGVSLIDPIILKFLIDDVLVAEQFRLLPMVIFIFIFVKLLSLFLFYLHGVGYTRFNQRFFLAIRNDLFEHLQYKEIGYFTQKEVGDLLRTLVTDVQALQQILNVLESIFTNLIRLILIGGIIYIFEWRLALLVIVFLPFYALVQLIYVRRLKRQAEKTVQADVNMFNFFEERLSNILLVKLFATEAREAQVGREISENYAAQIVRFMATVLLISTLIGLVSSAAIIAALWLGAQAVIAGMLTVGGLVAVYTYVGQMFGPVSALVSIPSSLQGALVAGERVFGAMAAPEEREHEQDEVRVTELQGKIVFDHVTFAYPHRPRQKIFQDLSLEIASGETVGIVGASGVGKTTLIRLLLRFYEPQKGKIAIDDRPLNTFARSSLRELIGVVPQENLFLPGTIRDNITYAFPSAPIIKLHAATKAAGIHEQIIKFPDGYGTQLGPDGKPLSAGERQRLSIARVILKDPDIFIFDEPTAELDTETERIVKQSIKKLSTKRTAIIIAHRFSTLELVDRILVLKNGKIIEEGSIKELTEKGGEFSRLYKLQSLRKGLNFPQAM